MRLPAILLTLLVINITFVFSAHAQEMPFVYEVENSGANFPKPYLPTFSELPIITSLPDPFEWSDGRGRIKNKSDWRYRRAEIKAEIENYEIGLKPNRPDTITASYLDGTLTVNITVNGKTLTLTSNIILPSGEGPFPAVIGIGSGSGSLPSDIFTSRGIAMIPFNFGQVMAHTQNRGSEPINRLYPELTYMGAYSAWPWGVSRLIDGLELVSNVLPINLKRLAITGCSFAGKMALFAGAFDERIALTIAQEPGGGGAAAWRFSQTMSGVETLGATSRQWFIESMFQFSGNNVSKLPHDHHELMAMVAPRALFVLGNTDYQWLAEESGYVSSMAAKEVWNALGIPDRFGFSIVGGHGHCALPNSQRPEVIAFVEKFLLGNENANTNVAVSPFNTDLSPWITWTTPTLSNDSTYYSTLVHPEDSQAGMGTNITFRWNKIKQAEKYYIQVSTDAQFKNIIKSDSTIADTLITFNDLSEKSKYYWRIQVKSSGGLGPWSSVSNFITTLSIPTTLPQLVSASPASNRTGYVNFTWNKVEDATQYYVQVSRVQTFASIFKSATVTDTTSIISFFSEGLKYYWRVQAENLAGSGPWSNIEEFTIIYAPNNFEVQANAANEVILSWKDNSTVEDGYIIERKNGSQSLFTILDTVNTNVIEYIDKNIENALTYIYRVKAYKGVAESDYSNEVSITITSVEEEGLPTEYSISQNYPNPFNPTTKLKFGLPQSSKTKLIVYDLLGRELKTLINSELEAGYHEINFDATNLPSGVYLYRIQSEDFIQTKKMILMK